MMDDHLNKMISTRITPETLAEFKAKNLLGRLRDRDLVGKSVPFCYIDAASEAADEIERLGRCNDQITQTHSATIVDLHVEIKRLREQRDEAIKAASQHAYECGQLEIVVEKLREELAIAHANLTICEQVYAEQQAKIERLLTTINLDGNHFGRIADIVGGDARDVPDGYDSSIAGMVEYRVSELKAEIEQLETERDEAREAARYCFNNRTNSGNPLREYAADKWPWLEDDNG